MTPQKTHRAKPTTRDALSTVRSRLPRQIMWAVLIGVISFGIAVLINH
jgi:hypothetical protein